MYEGIQNTDKWFPVILVDADNNGVTGKTTSNITVTYHFEGSTSRTTYFPSSSDWKEAGGGEYWLQIGASEFTQVGKYQLSISCSGCQTHRIPIEIKQYSFNEGGIKINFIYDRIGAPTDYGDGATVAGNLSSIYGHAYNTDENVDLILTEIGTPQDLGSGADLSNNMVDIHTLSAMSFPLINVTYGRIGTPQDLGSGADLSNNMVDIHTLSAMSFPLINATYGLIGTPADLGSGATIADNLTDINIDINTTYGAVATVNSKIDTIGVDIIEIDTKIGSPIDLGDGSTLADNFTSIAGKTAGASSFDRASDSLEAISDVEADNLNAETLKDILFNREVTGRHANGKPSIIVAGTGANQVEIHTTLDTAPGMEEYINKEEIAP